MWMIGGPPARRVLVHDRERRRRDFARIGAELRGDGAREERLARAEVADEVDDGIGIERARDLAAGGGCLVLVTADVRRHVRDYRFRMGMRPTNMRRLIVLLLFIIPLTAAAGDLQKAIAEIPESDLEEHDYDIRTVATRPGEIVVRAVKRHEDVVRALERALRISEAAAGPLAEAVCLNFGLEMSGGDAHEADALFREAVRQAPKSGPVLGAYIVFMSRQKELYPDFAAAALPYSRAMSAADVASVAESLYGEQVVTVAADALRSAPTHHELLIALTSEYSPAIRAAFIDPQWSSKSAADLIQAFVALDRPADALAVFDAAPRALEAEGTAEARIDLALAAAVVGKTKKAEELLRTASPPSYDARAKATITLIRALIAPNGDPYEALAEQVQSMNGGGGTWATACARLARRGGYDRFAESVLAKAERFREDGEAKTALQYLPKKLADRLRATMGQE